ncbi:MAG: hypothetical protein IT307_12510 [Chloroflexi bacterium]|nr:hypothetical protein [Chloroflexota bacterium]
MNISITADERSMLADLVQQGLQDLREEIYKTDTSTYRDQLHAREALFKDLLVKIEQART